LFEERTSTEKGKKEKYESKKRRVTWPTSVEEGQKGGQWVLLSFFRRLPDLTMGREGGERVR